MSDKSVSERIIHVFSEFKKTEPENIKMDTTFEELGFDSLDGLNLIFELEEEFDINIPDDAAEKIQTVGQAIDYIEKSHNGAQ